jgi:hypothetical protein
MMYIRVSINDEQINTKINVEMSLVCIHVVLGFKTGMDSAVLI